MWGARKIDTREEAREEIANNNKAYCFTARLSSPSCLNPSPYYHLTMHLVKKESAALLIAFWGCVVDHAAALDVDVSPLPEVWASWVMNSACRVSSADECGVEWLGSDNETTFKASLTLLTEIPNEHDTLAGVYRTFL